MQRQNLRDSGVGFHQYTLLIMIYYLIAPFEDLLTGSAGTVAKYIAVAIIIVGLINQNGAITLRFDTPSNCIVYLLLLSVASCIWATDRNVAFHRNTAYLLVPGLAFFVSQLEFSEEERESIITASIVGGFMMIVYLFLQGQIDLSDGGRMRLTEGNDQNNFAALIFLPFVLCVLRMIRVRTKKRLIYCGLALVLLYLILMTGSRGALMAILFAVLVFVLFSPGEKRLRLIVIMIVAATLANFIVLPMLPENIQARLFDNESYTHTMNSENNRMAFWKCAFTEIYPKNPIVGVGSGCVPIWLGKYFSYNRAMHNTYINMLCEYGLLGLPVFLRMLYSLFIKKKREGNPGEIALLAGICVIIFFLDAFAKKFFWNVIMLLMIDTTQINSVQNRHGYQTKQTAISGFDTGKGK